MKILVACEESGRVRDAFAARGHLAMSCDLLPSATPGLHYQGDIRDILYRKYWDMLLAFPPCTDLSVVGAGRWKEKQRDGRQQAALDFVTLLLTAPIPLIALENPVGRISTAIRKPDQIIQPWMFGDPWIKRTCLWLKGLPKLIPDQVVTPEGHWVDGGNNVRRTGVKFGDARFGSSTDAARKIERSKTFAGIARAMAAQWG